VFSLADEIDKELRQRIEDEEFHDTLIKTKRKYQRRLLKLDEAEPQGRGEEREH